MTFTDLSEMVRWICSVKLCEKISMSDLKTRMGISSIEDVIRYHRLRWFGLVISNVWMKKNGPERS